LLAYVLVAAGEAVCAIDADPNATLGQALVTHLLLRERETVLLDMVAGLEHLGRGTAASVDAMFIVAEPGQRRPTSRVLLSTISRPT
jgi:CO dehydrogenase maturation factor